MLKRFRTEASIFRDENIPLETELTKLSNEYDKAVGAMTIEWEGQTESLRSAVTEWQQEKARLETKIAELKKQNALLSS